MFPIASRGRVVARPRLGPSAADAVRRASLAAAAFAAALAAHAASGQAIDLLRVAPLVWIALLGASVLLRRLPTSFRERSAAAVVMSLAAAQVFLHLGFTYAPWAFGLRAHHLEPVVTVGSLAAHLAACAVLGLLLVRLERLLGAAARVARVLCSLLAPPSPRPRRAAPVARRRAAAHAVAGRLGGGIRPIRGPPLPFVS